MNTTKAEKMLAFCALCAVGYSIAHHISAPAGLGAVGALVWLDLTLNAWTRGR